METYDTVVYALNGLKARGYTVNFNIAFDKLMCTDNKICLNPDEFEIVEMYRFEGETAIRLMKMWFMLLNQKTAASKV